MPAATTASGRSPVVGFALLAFVLAACGQHNPYDLPKYDAAVVGQTPTSTGTPDGKITKSAKAVRAATPSPQVKFVPADALGQGAWAERGRSVANTPAERAAVTAVVRYLSARVRLSNTWQVDEAQLAATASGQAVTSARERAERQRQQDRRSIGRFVVNASTVRVNGAHATVTGCHFDATSEVDRDGNVLIAPPGGVLITMHLQRTGRTWRVLDWPTRSVPSCDWRS
jgi:predicted small lipoprotein YifL